MLFFSLFQLCLSFQQNAQQLDYVCFERLHQYLSARHITSKFHISFYLAFHQQEVCLGCFGVFFWEGLVLYNSFPILIFSIIFVNRKRAVASNCIHRLLLHRLGPHLAAISIVSIIWHFTFSFSLGDAILKLPR